MSTTGGTVRNVRTLDAKQVARMTREIKALALAHRRSDSTTTRTRRDDGIVAWHRSLGEGSLSLIARTAGISRVQAGRIVAAARHRARTGESLPTRHFYQ